MGLFSTIWKGIKTVGRFIFGGDKPNVAQQAAGNVLGGVGGGIGNAVGNQIGGAVSDSLGGIPNPMTGAEKGAQQLQYMDAAFPGTNSWDRLGQGSIMGQVAGAEIAERNAMKMKNRELTSAQQIADKQTSSNTQIASLNNKTQLESSKINAIAHAAAEGPDVLNNVLRAINGQPVENYIADKHMFGFGRYMLRGLQSIPKGAGTHWNKTRLAPQSIMKESTRAGNMTNIKIDGGQIKRYYHGATDPKYQKEWGFPNKEAHQAYMKAKGF